MLPFLNKILKNDYLFTGRMTERHKSFLAGLLPGRKPKPGLGHAEAGSQGQLLPHEQELAEK